MAASWKCFEDQSDMPLCLIQPLSLGEGGGGGLWGRQKEWFSVTRVMGGVVETRFSVKNNIIIWKIIKYI